MSTSFGSGPQSRPSGEGRKGGCGAVAVGFVLGALVAWLLPIHVERVRTRGIEAVRLSVLGVEVHRSVGPPGEHRRAVRSVRTVMACAFGLLGAAAFAGIGAMLREPRPGP